MTHEQKQESAAYEALLDAWNFLLHHDDAQADGCRPLVDKKGNIIYRHVAEVLRESDDPHMPELIDKSIQIKTTNDTFVSVSADFTIGGEQVTVSTEPYQHKLAA